jgi:glycosyltransferase involved in cell wall biosynthesis
MSKANSNLYSEVPEIENPLISIILVCLNSKKTIEQTLLSVINLDYPKKEFIVIDGGSVDGTIDILNKYIQNISYLIVEHDNGPYEAMNKGTKIANGEFFYFLGADDIIVNSWRNLSGKLRSGNTIYYGNAYFPVTNQIYDGKFTTLKLLSRNICHQAIFYPRGVFEKYQYTNEYPYLEDFHLNMLLKGDSDFRFRYIDFLVAVFSQKGISSTRADIKFLKDRLEIIRKHYSLIIYLYFCVYFFLKRTMSKWLT